MRIMTIKEKIVISATNLFLSSSLKTVTMDEIANEMGISKRTIYENFSNKKELIVASVEYQHQKQHVEINEAISGCENVFAEIFAVFSMVDDSFKLRGRFMDELKRFYPEIFENSTCKYYEESIESLRDRLRRGIRQGLILPETNINFAVFVVIEVIYSILSRTEMIPVKDVSGPRAFIYVLTYFFRGISTEKGIHLIDELILKNNKKR